MAYDTRTSHLNKKITNNTLITQMMKNRKLLIQNTRRRAEFHDDVDDPDDVLKKNDELPHPSH